MSRRGRALSRRIASRFVLFCQVFFTMLWLFVIVGVLGYLTASFIEGHWLNGPDGQAQRIVVAICAWVALVFAMLVNPEQGPSNG